MSLKSPSLAVIAAFAVLIVGDLGAQTPSGGAQAPSGSAQAPSRGAQTPSGGAQATGGQRGAGRGPARPVAVPIVVRDASGGRLEGVRVSVAGPDKTSLSTDAGGNATANVAPGSYRFRFDRDGYVSLEREVTVRAGQQSPIEVWLALAPPPPTPPPPPPAPVVIAPPPPPPKAAPGPPVALSITDFLDKNFISGRDPLKESVIGCMEGGTTRLVQLRDGVAMHAHAETDEVLYVIAGEGKVQTEEKTTTLAPGTLMVLPRGLKHALQRGGKSPLVLISVLSGTPCRPVQTAQGAGQ